MEICQLHKKNPSGKAEGFLSICLALVIVTQACPTGFGFEN